MLERNLEISGFSLALESKFLARKYSGYLYERISWNEMWFTHLYISPSITSKCCSSAKYWHLSVHTCSSCTSSGTIRNVRQPRIFFDFSISPNMWSPTYSTSLPLALMKLVKTSHEPPEYTLPGCRGPMCVPIFKAPVCVSTCRSMVPSPKNSGFAASTTITSKYVFQLRCGSSGLAPCSKSNKYDISMSVYLYSLLVSKKTLAPDSRIRDSTMGRRGSFLT